MTEATQTGALVPAEQKVGASGIVAGQTASGAVQTGSTSRTASAGAVKLDPSVKSAIANLAAPAADPETYKIGAADVLDISVFKVPELTKSVQVAGIGTVNLPLVGEVPVVGRTPQEVERDLTAKLGAKYLQNPQVTVFVKEYNSQTVTVDGAVKKPGVYPLRGKTTLVQAIATAEGLTEIADSEVVVFRGTSGKKTAAKFNLDDIRAGSAPDPSLAQGDVVVINTSATKTAFQNVLKVLPAANIFVPLL